MYYHIYKGSIYENDLIKRGVEMSNKKLICITADNAIFSSDAYLNDKVTFNYIETSKQLNSTQLYSDGKYAVICRKDNHKNIWIWTNDEIQNDVDFIMEIAKTVKDFGITKPEFFTKPNIAQVFSDMYALVSNDLDYQIKDEFSLGAYKYVYSDTNTDDSITVQKYNKKHYDALLDFYKNLSDEFCWEADRAKNMVDLCEKISTFVLFKNGDIISVCAISDNQGKFCAVRSVATKQTERNKGYGTLVTSIASASLSKKDKTIMVYANKGNESAISTFKKSGFHLVGNIHLIKS